MNSERILVCGDRDWWDKPMIKRWLSKFPKTTVVIEGEARGADQLAREAAGELGMKVLRFPVLPEEYQRAGRGGPTLRNQRMIDEGKPTRVDAFHDDIDSSRGTADMLRKARRVGLPTRLHKHR